MSREHRFGLRHALLGGLVVFGSLLGASVVCCSKSQAAPPAEAGSQLAAAVKGKPYTVTVTKVSTGKGQAATTQVVIKPAAGYHMNTDFPTSLKLRPADGITFAKAELKKADAKLSETEGSFPVTITAAKAGRQTVSGDLSFAVCTETTCEPQKSPVTIELEVK